MLARASALSKEFAPEDVFTNIHLKNKCFSSPSKILSVDKAKAGWDTGVSAMFVHAVLSWESCTTLSYIPLQGRCAWRGSGSARGAPGVRPGSATGLGLGPALPAPAAPLSSFSSQPVQTSPGASAEWIWSRSHSSCSGHGFLETLQREVICRVHRTLPVAPGTAGELRNEAGHWVSGFLSAAKKRGWESLCFQQHGRRPL